jgi:hypothetical protein
VNSTTFDMTVSLDDERFVGAVAVLVLQAAAYAGCPAADAAQFAKTVEDAITASLGEPRDHPLLPVIVRRRSGPIEVVMNGRTLSLDV